MDTTKIGEGLQPVSSDRKGQIALTILVDKLLVDSNLIPKPNEIRRSLIADSLRLGIDPNEMLSMLHDMVMPQMAKLFQPISQATIDEYKADLERRRLEREAKKTDKK